MAGRDLSAELFSPMVDASTGGRDLSGELQRPDQGTVLGAFASGANRGLLSNLLGLPVDTMANAVDLAKAGYGTAVTAAGRPDLAPSINDRTNIPFSSAWLANKINQGSNALGVQSPIENPNPSSALARIAHGVGQGVGGSITPATASVAARNAIMGGLSGLASQSAAEVAPENAGAQILAGMIPQAIPSAANAATKFALRGGEQGRQAMAQRVADLKNAGIESPSLGLASGSPLVMGMENLASKLPGSVGTYQEANAKNFSGMQNKIAGLRDLASSNYGPFASGNALQTDIGNFFQSQIQPKYNALLDKAVSVAGPNTQVPISNSLASTKALSTPSTGAPAATKSLINNSIKSLAEGLQSDVSPQTKGNPNSAFSLGSPPTQIEHQEMQTIPLQDLRNLRSDIGANTRSKDILSTPAEAQYKNIYGAMSQDLQQAFANADRNNLTRLQQLRGMDTLTPSQIGELNNLEGMNTTRQGRQQLAQSVAGPLQYGDMPASNAWNRSNALYSGAMERMGQLNPYANKTPEQAYSAYVKNAPNNLSALEAVKKSITPETRASIAASALDQLGNARPSSQNDAGSVFSPETYLTNFNKLSPEGQRALFSGFETAPQVREGAADVAKGASLLRDASKIWANPSGTGGNLTAAATTGGILSNVIGSPMTALGGLAGLAGANQVSKRMLLNPDMIKYLISRENPNTAQGQSNIQAILNSANMSSQEK